jgi:predicted patatin/cPLA2 family phospholipase
LGVSRFELAFAVSASVPTLAYFLAGQCKEGREVWENYLSTNRLIRYSSLFFGWKDDYRHRPLIDLHYLVYEVFRDRFPLKTDRLRASMTEAYFVATDAETYLPHYFQPDQADIYHIMRACMALPGAVPEKPLVNGRAYVDGGIVDPLPVGKALKCGADRLLVILTIPPEALSKRTTILERLAARRYFKDNPGLLDVCDKRNDPLTHALDLLEKLELKNPGSVLVVRPKNRLPAGRITRNRSKIVKTLRMGYEEVLRNEESIGKLLA